MTQDRRITVTPSAKGSSTASRSGEFETNSFTPGGVGLIIGVDHPARPESVVRHDHPTRFHQFLQQFDIAGIVRFVCVQERQVEGTPQVGQGLDSRTQQQRDAFCYPGIRPGLPGHGRVFLGYVAANDLSPLRQRFGHEQ